MANYIAIFTIDGGADQDYIALGRLLEKARFSKVIQDDQQVTYYLPL